MPTPARDHAGVFIPPPLFYVLPFAAAYLIDRRHPAPIVAETSGRGSPLVATLAAGGLLVALAVALFGAAFWRFGRARTAILPVRPTTTVVDSGIYGVTRNPMYLAFAVAYLGATLLVNSLWPLLFLPVAIAAVQLYAISREERYLEAKFGDEYRRYKARVRRWI